MSGLATVEDDVNSGRPDTPLMRAVDVWVDRNWSRIEAMEGEITADMRCFLPGLNSGVYFVGVRHAGCTDDCDGLDDDEFGSCFTHVKIGYAVDVYTRFHNIKCSNPHPVELMAMFAGTLKDERDLHAVFKPVRHRREWFAYCREMHELVGTLFDYGGFCRAVR